MKSKKVKKINPFAELANNLSVNEGVDSKPTEPIVGIQEFIESPKFLNQKWNGKSGCRPEMMKIIIDVSKDEIREAMLLLGKGCLAGKTLITLADGSVCRMDKLYKKYGTQIAFKILNYNIKTNEQVMSNAVVKYSGFKTVYKIKLRNGMKLEVTKNHNMPTFFGKKKVKDLKIGDSLSVSKSQSLISGESVLTNEEARFLGYMVGDGYTGKRGIKRFCFTNGDKVVLKDFLRCLKSIDPDCKPHQDIRPTKTMIWFGNRSTKCVNASNLIFSSKLNGKTSKTKHVPISIRKSSKKIIGEFLVGYWMSDGECNLCWGKKRKEIYFDISSISSKLMNGVRDLLLRLEIQPILRHWCKDVDSGTKIYKNYSGKSVCFSGDENHNNFYKYVKLISYKGKNQRYGLTYEQKLTTAYHNFFPKDISKEIRKRLDEVITATDRNILTGRGKKINISRYISFSDLIGDYRNIGSGDVNYSEIVSIERIKKKEVFDITILCQEKKEFRNYIANGIVVGNSGKDYGSAILHLYGIYKGLCYENPQEHYGLAPGSPIYFVNTARNDTQAKKVFFMQFKGMLTNCLWFDGKYDEPSSNEVRFNKGLVALSVNSQAFGWLGFNTIQWVGDELAFFLENDNDEGSNSRAEECWQAAFGSCQTRFPKYYKMIGITTPRFDDDFVMRKCRELQGRSDGYFIQKPTWDIHPDLTKETFKNEFIRDPRRTMRDFGAQPMGLLEGFFAEPDFLENNVKQECKICEVYVNRKISTDDYECMDFEDCRQNPYMGNGKFAEWFKPNLELEYYMHFDLSKNKDWLGFTMGHSDDTILVEKSLSEILAISDKSKKGIEIDEEDRMSEKPLIGIDIFGFINPKSQRDDELVRNSELYYPGIFKNIVVKLKCEMGFNIVKITFDQFQCLIGSTNIITNRGMLKLKDVEVGDFVPTRIGLKEVVSKMKYEKAPCLKITTKSGNTITGTHNHRIEVLDYWKQEKYGEPRTYYWKWKRFDEIENGETVRMSDEMFSNQLEDVVYNEMVIPEWFTNKTTMRYDNIALPEYMTPKLAELVGLIWGDGNFERDGDKIAISGTVDEIGCCEKLIFDLFNFKPCVNNKGDGNGVSVYWNSKIIGNYLRANSIFKKSYDKHLKIPKIILNSSGDVVGAFLRGLFSADGSVDKNDGSSILSTTSRIMARQVKYALQMFFGVRSTIITVLFDGSASCYGIIGKKYHVKTTGDRLQFLNSVGYCYENKNMKAEKFKNVKGRIICEKVFNIKSVDNEDVYDLTVDGDHSYVANGFVSHNSHYFKQNIEDLGIEVDLISTDRTDVVPTQAKVAFSESRVEYPYCKRLCREGKELMIKNGKKVDHPKRGCFIGYQDIYLPMLDTSIKIETLAHKFKHVKFEVISYDKKLNKFVITKANSPRFTKMAEELVEIELVSGGFITCTLDHLIMMGDGVYKEAYKISQNDLLMGQEDKIVKSVKIVRCFKRKMYDITVPIYNNFMLGNGVMVHNSKDIWDSVSCVISTLEEETANGSGFIDLTIHR